ncbi:hypothetical protein CHELA20_51748 [Hyphomicrobiales bacterium]|nr:hypothetical protein CHELA41_23266 [Hyphomicrobiales bacterium]CAH1678223.1 hypothetical protein CHELA20_51748 [Hyphomicrobiales bacterium]
MTFGRYATPDHVSVPNSKTLLCASVQSNRYMRGTVNNARSMRLRMS